MRTHKGESVSYGMTSAGIMVQVQTARPSNAEWDTMLDALRQESSGLLGIVIVATGSEGPTGAQRQSVAKVATTYSTTFRGVVLLTSSSLVRASLAAINWLIPGGVPSHAFGLNDLDRGLAALKLDIHQAKEVKALVAELSPAEKKAAG